MATSQKQTSLKQIEANRRNSEKTTGPKTEAGKRASSQNAHKHGLASKQIVIQSATYSEDPVEYELLLESLHEELKPVGKLEEHLVTKIANCIWRSHRVIRAETAHINSRMDNAYEDVEAAERSKKWSVHPSEAHNFNLTKKEKARVKANSAGQRSIPDDSTAHYILRCEMRLDRQLSRAYALLHLRQAKRAADFRKVKTVYKEEKLPPGVRRVGPDYVIPEIPESAPVTSPPDGRMP